MTTVAIEVASHINFSQGARARCKFACFYQIYPPSIDTLETVEWLLCIKLKVELPTTLIATLATGVGYHNQNKHCIWASMQKDQCKYDL